MQSIYPVLKYEDAHAAIEFLESAFGLEPHEVYEGKGGKVDHAQLSFGGQLLMLSSTGAGNPIFDQGAGTTSVYLAVEEVDALHDRAAQAGAEIVMPLTDQEYGSRDFVARDPEGNLWCFGTYQPEGG